MRGAYERPPVDRRVRKRLRTGSGGTSKPGKPRKNRAQSGKFGQTAGSMVLYVNCPCRFCAFFAQNWHCCRGKMRFGCTKRSPHQCEIWRAKIGTDVRTFFSPLSRGGPFVKVLDCGLCRQLALLLGQKSTKSTKIDKNCPRNSPTLPDTAGRPRIVENR